MSFKVAGPYPGLQTTTILPNPQFSDNERLEGEVQIKRSINGTSRTYVKSKSRRRALQWTFRLTRNKAIELFEFVRSYHSVEVFVEDHRSRQWRGFITVNPFEIEMAQRAAPAVQDWPVGETVEATVEFAGFRVDTVTRSATILNESASTVVPLDDTLDGSEFSLPTFAPLLVHNWDAAAITGISDGDTLGAWTDDGPAGADLFAVTGRPPTYRTGVVNGLPVVEFGDVTLGTGQVVQDAMSTANNVSLFPGRRGTVFWVHQHDHFNGTGPFGLLVDNADVAMWHVQSAQGTEEFNISGGPNKPANAYFEPNGTVDPVLDDVGNVIPAGFVLVYMLMREDDTTIRFRVNGIEKVGVTITNNAPRTAPLKLNQASGVSGFNKGVRGKWGQMLAYNKNLSATEVDEVERYLGLKWGAQIGTDYSELV